MVEMEVLGWSQAITLRNANFLMICAIWWMTRDKSAGCLIE